jgi:hypothetical protein
MALILDGSNGLSDVDGTAAAPAIRGTDTNTGIFFPAADTIAFSEGGTESMRIDGSGNLGVGTTSPSAILETSVNASSGSVNAVFRNSNNGANTTKTISASFRGADTVSGSKEASRILVGPADQDWNGSYLSFQTRGSDVLTERMRINSSGNLLVGTTASKPARLLSYGASGATAGWFSSNFSGDTTVNAVRVDKFDNNTTTSQVFVNFSINNDGAANGQINANGASQVAFGSWSDARLKENIKDLPPQLANITALRPVEFDYIKSEGGGHQIGFVAQEMQAIYPDAVGERTDGMLTVTGWGKTEAYLVAAIKELKATVDAQAARIAALENPPVESATNE